MGGTTLRNWSSSISNFNAPRQMKTLFLVGTRKEERSWDQATRSLTLFAERTIETKMKSLCESQDM